MAYPYICDACLAQEHERCEVQRGEGYGTGFCVCNAYGHDVSKSEFAQSVWDKAIQSKVKVVT